MIEGAQPRGMHPVCRRPSSQSWSGGAELQARPWLACWGRLPVLLTLRWLYLFLRLRGSRDSTRSSRTLSLSAQNFPWRWHVLWLCSVVATSFM